MEHIKQIEIKFVFKLTYNNPFPEDFILLDNLELPELILKEKDLSTSDYLKKIWDKYIEYKFEYCRKNIFFEDVILENGKCIILASVEIPFSNGVYKNGNCYTINEIIERNKDLYGKYGKYFRRRNAKPMLFIANPDR